MTLTRIDIDEDALSEAMRLSGAKTKKDTVNLALREFAARHRRVAAVEHFATLAAGWDFEGWQHRRVAKKLRRNNPPSPRLAALWRILRTLRCEDPGQSSFPGVIGSSTAACRMPPFGARTLDEYE